MFNQLGSRLQKSMDKIRSKLSIKEEDVLEITRDIRMALLEADVNLLVVKYFIKSIKEKVIGSELVGKLNPGQQMIKIVNEELTNILGGKVKEIELKNKLSVLMLVGLQGSGKTTSVSKLAFHFRKKKLKNKILLIAADVYRPAAIDQLVTLGKQLTIDVFFDKELKSPQEIVKLGLEKANIEEYDMVIIDTAGRLSIDEQLMQELCDLKKIASPQEIIYVADSMSGQDIINVAQSFNDKLSLTGSIITKLDSDARGGAALSLTHMLKIPIIFIGTGEKVNNFELFHPDRMAGRILGMGDVLSLIEKAEGLVDEKQANKMMNKMMRGKFDLDDLLKQLQQLKKLGKFSKLLKMIPGAGSIDKTKIDSAEKKQKLFEILISSMTYEERKNPKLLKNSSRKKRIMTGSGRSAQDYNLLVNEFERMAKQMKEMSSKMKNGTFNPSSMLGKM